MEGIILVVFIQYVVEYRLSFVFFQILVDGFKRVFS
jgi:hypothetical protein